VNATAVSALRSATAVQDRDLLAHPARANEIVMDCAGKTRLVPIIG